MSEKGKGMDLAKWKKRREFRTKRSTPGERRSQVLDGAPTDVPPSDPRDSWRSEARLIRDGLAYHYRNV
jgi:hypothetical protein